MFRNLSILLVEDDNTACKEITDYIDELEDVTLVGTTNSSQKALEIVYEMLPDAVILDLELHNGEGDGLTFLTKLKESTVGKMPYILVTTNNSSSVTYEFARNLGADFIMFKHQSDYSGKNVVEFLKMMKNMIQSKADTCANHDTAESPDQKNKRMNKMIALELDRIGINPKAVGYTYLCEAIQLVVKGSSQNLCSILGKKYGKTESSVERAMQNAINRAWCLSDIDDLLQYYTAKIRSEKGVPTITEFIHFYSHKIKNDL